MAGSTLHCAVVSPVVLLGVLSGCTTFHARTGSKRQEYAHWVGGLSDVELDAEIDRLDGATGHTRGKGSKILVYDRPNRVRDVEPAGDRRRPVFHNMAWAAGPAYSAHSGPPAMPLRVVSGSFSGIGGAVGASYGGGIIHGGQGTFQATLAGRSKGLQSPFHDPLWRRVITIRHVRDVLSGTARHGTRARTGSSGHSAGSGHPHGRGVVRPRRP